MRSEDYDHEATTLARQLPAQPRLAVIGSTSFHGDDSSEICTTIGARLATLANLVLLTGGVSGVGERVGRSFFTARQQSPLPPGTYHILPRGLGSWDYGITLFGGDDMGERREILGRLATVYLSIEGGPGTAHEAEVARSKGASVVPVGRTGGFSGELYRELDCPDADLAGQWRVLGDRTASVEQVGAAVEHVIEFLLRESPNPG